MQNSDELLGSDTGYEDDGDDDDDDDDDVNYYAICLHDGVTITAVDLLSNPRSKRHSTVRRHLPFYVVWNIWSWETDELCRQYDVVERGDV